MNRTEKLVGYFIDKTLLFMVGVYEEGIYVSREFLGAWENWWKLGENWGSPYIMLYYASQIFLDEM